MIDLSCSGLAQVDNPRRGDAALRHREIGALGAGPAEHLPGPEDLLLVPHHLAAALAGGFEA